MFPMIKYGSSKELQFKLVDDAGDAVSVTLVAGDVKISKDHGSFTNVTNLPVEIGTTGIYWFVLTGTETTCKNIAINIKDQTVPAVFVESSMIMVTGGNANAWFAG
jgi:hypothetical protein